MELLRDKGAQIAYSDPHVPVFPKMREHRFDLSSIEITAETLQHHDCVIIATNHDRFDYELIRQNAKLLIDTRGVYKKSENNIIKA